jgi:hypothetical protein
MTAPMAASRWKALSVAFQVSLTWALQGCGPEPLGLPERISSFTPKIGGLISYVRPVSYFPDTPLNCAGFSAPVGRPEVTAGILTFGRVA